MSTSTAPISVLQSCNSWLPTTQKWLHTQVSALPEDIRSPVAARCAENLDAFPVDELHVRDTDVLGVFPIGHLLKGMAKVGLFNALIQRRQAQHWADFRREIVRKRKVDLVHSHFGHHAIRDVPVVRSEEVAHVVSFYGYDAGFLPRKYPEIVEDYHDVFESASAVLCEGPHFAETIESLGCSRDKIRVHHLGVDLENHPFRPRALNDPGDPVRILMAASFKQKKGLPDAIRALGGVHTSHDIEVTLIGEADDSRRSKREHRRIRQAIEESDLGDSIRQKGFVPYDRLVDEMLDHHIFLSPSRTAETGDTEGGAPVSIIAAQATGMPVTSTRHADIPHVLEHGETGLLADERSVSQIRAHLERLIDAPDSWAKLGKNARERIEAEFDARKQGERLGEIYRDVVTP